MNGYIYKFTSPSNKVYIGITKNLKERYYKHKCLVDREYKRALYKACEKLNVRHQHVSAILRGKQKTTKGYSFKYI